MKRISFLYLFIILLSCHVEAQNTQSGFTLFASFSLRNETGTPVGDQTLLTSYWRGGYKTSQGWYFGMIYSRSYAAGAFSLNETGIGNSVGYFYGMASVIFSYYFASSTSEQGLDGTYGRSEGMGPQLDFSIAVPLSKGYSIVPTLTYKSITYQKQENNGRINAYQSTQTFLYPFIGIMKQF